MKHYIDIGSGTVKVYCADGLRLDLVSENSLFFKDGFDPKHGIAESRIESMIKYLEELKLPKETQTFATGIWREAPKEQIEKVNKLMFDKIGYGLNVISHEEEGNYLKHASDLNYQNKKVLVINMGGKTTEIVTHNSDGTTSTQLLPIGVAEINAKFPEINNVISSVGLDEIEAFCANKISDLKFDDNYDFALFTGELRFDKLSKYPLEPNKMFKDENHPFEMSLSGFIKGTEHIFYDLTMDDLRALMPGNPKWMDGARAGATLPLAIFRRAKIQTIVPSDINLINGVVKVEQNA